MRNLFPRKALPDSEGNRDGRVKVTTGSGRAGNDSESDTNGKTPTDLKDTAKGCDIGVRGIQVKGGDGCYAREAICLINPMDCFEICRKNLHIEEDSRSFCHTLPQPAGSWVISVRNVQGTLNYTDRACSKSSFRWDTGFPATTFRDKCC